MGIGKISIPLLAYIDNILYVKGLKYILLSISQFCDNGYIVSFNKNQCIVKTEYVKSFFTARQHNNLYEIDLIGLSQQNVTCLLSRQDDRCSWHKKLGHVNLKHISKLSKRDLVKRLPKIYWKTHLLYEACPQGKQIKTSFKSKDVVSTTQLLQLLHMDVFGPTRRLSLRGKKYGFVVIDDYLRYTWIYFLANKHESFKVFEILCKKVQNEKGFCISSIRNDHGTKFENAEFKSFYERSEIFLNFSSPRTPQQNEIVERKNRTLQEMVRTMLCEKSFPKHF